jgi:hypothetical protein
MLKVFFLFVAAAVVQTVLRNSELPDGIFVDQKSQFWYVLVGIKMKIFGIVNGHLPSILL